MRNCTKCKTDKPLAEFGKNKNGPDGLNYWCKQCSRASAKSYAERNKDKVSAKSKRYYEENSDRLRAEALERYHLDAEAKRLYNRQWKAENAERVKAYQREYVKANLDRYNIYYHDRRARLLSNGGSHTQEEWEMLCEAFGNVCLACGEEKPLTKDHVVPIKLGGTNDIWNIQPLCQSCNSSKGATTIDYRQTV